MTGKQLAALAAVIDRMLPDTYRLTAVRPSNEQSLRAALLWAGETASAAGRSAGEMYRLEVKRVDPIGIDAWRLAEQVCLLAVGRVSSTSRAPRPRR